MKLMKMVAAFLLVAGLCVAADVTGKWVATVQGRDGQTREMVYNLKADGSTLTGTMTGMGGQEIQISNGKVNGDNISFDVKMEFNGNSVVMNYKGVVSGDEIKFTQSREGSDRTREITAKRAK